MASTSCTVPLAAAIVVSKELEKEEEVVVVEQVVVMEEEVMQERISEKQDSRDLPLICQDGWSRLYKMMSRHVFAAPFWFISAIHRTEGEGVSIAECASVCVSQELD